MKNKLKCIYEHGKYKIYEAEVYEASGSLPAQIGHIYIDANREEYAILDKIDSYTNWGKDHQPGINGVGYILLLTDDASKRIDARHKTENHRKEMQEEWNTNWKLYFTALESKIASSSEIAVKVSFADKELFKQTFGNKASWNKEQKSWALNHNMDDMDRLKIDAFSKNNEFNFSFAFAPNSNANGIEEGFREYMRYCKQYVYRVVKTEEG